MTERTSMTPSHRAAVSLDAGTVALRLFRVDAKRNEFLNFEAVTFPRDPYAGCHQILRQTCGGITEDGDGPRGLDALDENGDILQTFTLTRHAFEFLRRKLKTRREVTQ